MQHGQKKPGVSFKNLDLTPALLSEAPCFFRVTPGFSKTPAPSYNLFSALYPLDANICSTLYKVSGLRSMFVLMN